MFLCVRFKDDGVRTIVTPDKVKRLDIENIDYNKAYKVLFDDGNFYRAHIISTGETAEEALAESEKKRFRIPNSRYGESTQESSSELDAEITNDLPSKKTSEKELRKAAMLHNYSNILSEVTKKSTDKNDETKTTRNDDKRLTSVHGEDGERTESTRDINIKSAIVLTPNNKEINELKMEIANLKSENKELNEEVKDLSRLNRELQQVVIDKFKDFCTTVADQGQPELELDLPVGTRLNGNIHLGRNVWLPGQIYDSAASKPKRNNYSLFIKEISYALFGEQTLMSSSVTGRQSNRTKAEAKPPLDCTKLMAIHDIVRYTLESNGESFEKTKEVMDSINHRIGEKMQDLLKPKLKARKKDSHENQTNQTEVEN